MSDMYSPHTDHHFGRAVIMFGIPYVYTQSRILKVRLWISAFGEHFVMRKLFIFLG